MSLLSAGQTSTFERCGQWQVFLTQHEIHARFQSNHIGCYEQCAGFHLLYPARRPQLPHARVHEREAGLPLLPRPQHALVAAPLLRHKRHRTLLAAARHTQGIISAQTHVHGSIQGRIGVSSPARITQTLVMPAHECRCQKQHAQQAPGNG